MNRATAAVSAATSPGRAPDRAARSALGYSGLLARFEREGAASAMSRVCPDLLWPFWGQ